MLETVKYRYGLSYYGADLLEPPLLFEHLF